MNRLCTVALIWGAALMAGAPHEIAGRVVDAQTGAPIARARVSITRVGNRSDEVVVITGDDGAFDLTGVPEGGYMLSCDRAGYLRGFQSVGIQLAPVAADAKPIPVVIRLTAQAVIEGTVLDENGGAMPFANVQVYRRVAIEGRRQAQSVSQAQADDQGSFRVFGLPAGAYCIGVTIYPPDARHPKLAYPPVFYPNSPTVADAQFLNLAPGQDQEIRIRLPRPVPAREIRGQIVPASEGLNIQLRPADSMPLGQPSAFELHLDQKTHTFKFTGVTPGAYVIDATAQVGGELRRATTSVTVAGQDITGLRLELSNQMTLTGTVRVEGEAAPVPPPPNVALHSPSFHFSAAVQPDGTFEFRNLPPDTYRVIVFPPGAAFVRSAWCGGRDVLHDGLTISGETPPAPLEISLGVPGGTVEGTVALRDIHRPDAVVVALLRRSGDAMVLEKNVAVSGTNFTLTGVAPGDYLLFAWPADAEVEYAEPEFARQYQDFGIPVTVTGGATVTVNIDRLASRIQI